MISERLQVQPDNEEEPPEGESEEVLAFREQYRLEHLAGNDTNGNEAWDRLLTFDEKIEYRKKHSSALTILSSGNLAVAQEADFARLDELAVKRGHVPHWLADLRAARQKQEQESTKRMTQESSQKKQEDKNALAKFRERFGFGKKAS